MRFFYMYVAGTLTECLLRRDVHLRVWVVKNAVFVYGWDLD